MVILAGARPGFSAGRRTRVPTGRHRSDHRPRWRTAAAAVALLPAVAMTGAAATQTTAASPATSVGPGWQSLWMGTTTDFPTTTLASARTMIGASSGAAA